MLSYQSLMIMEADAKSRFDVVSKLLNAISKKLFQEENFYATVFLGLPSLRRFAERLELPTALVWARKGRRILELQYEPIFSRSCS